MCEGRHEVRTGRGEKDLHLEGHEAELAKLAGQKVTVKGILKGDTLPVKEVAASK
jgi:hypothetical protein